MLLAACSSGPSPAPKKGKFDPKYGVSASARVATKDGEFRKGGGHYKVGRPYKVAGRTYVPKDQPGYNKTGKASWYGDDFHGRLTANGEIFDMNTLTAAHPTLPLPSYARVTNLKNGRSVIVRINDRGPYAHNRIIDLSKRVADVLAFRNDGITNVRVKYVGRARMDGQDARYLEASYREKGQRIGDDFRAVPKEGERRPAPAIMVASAKPAQTRPKPTKKRDNYLLAHVPALGTPSVPSMPSPIDLAAAPKAGWAPVDLVGDGYFPPSALENLKGSISLAQMAPVQLNYAKATTQRVATGHAAIEALFDGQTKPTLEDALARKAAKDHAPISATNAKNLRLIGTFEATYAMRLAEEFAMLGAVDLSARPNGQISLSIMQLKAGVRWTDIRAAKRRLGLSG